MKTCLKYIIIISLLFFTACKKYLREYNPGGATAESVFTTPAGFESGVNAAYSYNRWIWGKEAGYHLYEASSDIWMSGVDDPNAEITQFSSGLNPANPVIAAMWSRLYAAVNLCNALINRIGTSGLSAGVQRTREGELRLLRAWYYHTIVETWGNVHFTLNETQGITTTANKTPVDSFYKYIIHDLRVAVASLPNTTTDIGRATRPAAEAFLSKVFLNRNQFDSAYFYANRVITQYGFQLQAKYEDLWSMGNQNNKEIIWVVPYSTNLTLNDFSGPASALVYPGGHPRGANNGHLMFLQKYDVRPGMERSIANGRPFSRYMPTRSLLDLFDETRDARYAASFQEVWFSNKSTPTTYNRQLTNGTTATFTINPGDTSHWVTKQAVTNAFRDSRKYEIFDRSNVYNANGTPRNTSNFVSLKKFLDPTRPSVAEQQSARDAFIFRLADIILIAAEAKHRLGDNVAAAALINQVRTRAALPGQAAAMQITAADISIDFILDERARELAGEQWRWYDLKRTGKLVQRIVAMNPQAGANIKNHHIVRPIPQTQIDAVTNKNEFTQHPGY